MSKVITFRKRAGYITNFVVLLMTNKNEERKVNECQKEDRQETD